MGSKNKIYLGDIPDDSRITIAGVGNTGKRFELMSSICCSSQNKKVLYLYPISKDNLPVNLNATTVDIIAMIGGSRYIFANVKINLIFKDSVPCYKAYMSRAGKEESRRKEDRLPCKLNGWIKYDNKSVNGIFTNISYDGGLFVTGMDARPEGDVFVNIRSPHGGNIFMRAKVVRVGTDTHAGCNNIAMRFVAEDIGLNLIIASLQQSKDQRDISCAVLAEA